MGAKEFDYDEERPRYKRLNTALPAAERKRFRADECDELIRRMSLFANGSPSIDIRSHPSTAELLEKPSPLDDVGYKHREDLLDAALCAWTAALWSQHGTERCQVLGESETPDEVGRRPTIIAPAKPAQRR